VKQAPLPNPVPDQAPEFITVCRHCMPVLQPSILPALRPHRGIPAAVLLAVASLFAAGCMGEVPPDCEPLRDRAVVESVHGRGVAHGGEGPL
jgi:hypothetical protein